MAGPLAGLKIIELSTALLGNARVVLMIARDLRKLGAEVEVWGLRSGGAVGEQLEREGFPTRVLGLSKHGYSLATSRALAGELAAAKPDWVHAHSYESAVHASRAKKRGTPFGLIAQHHDSRLRWTRRLVNWPYRTVPEAFIVPSPSAARAYERAFGFPRERMHVVPYPLPDEFFEEPVRDEALARDLELARRYPVAMWVARLQKQKGHADLLRAMKMVAARYPDALLLLVGDGKTEEKLREMADGLGLARNVRLLGSRSDVAALLTVTDIFVCPSHAESLCMAVQEAMARGRAVVSTRVWGPVDHLRDGENGLLVPIGDAEAMGEAMLRLANDREEAARMGRAARGHAAGLFTNEIFEQNLLEVYRAAMSRARG